MDYADQIAADKVGSWTCSYSGTDNFLLKNNRSNKSKSCKSYND